MNTCALVLLHSVLTVTGGLPQPVYVDPCAVIKVGQSFSSPNETWVDFVNDRATLAVRGNVVDIAKTINEARSK